MFEVFLLAIWIPIVAFSIILVLCALFIEPPNMKPKACSKCGDIYHAMVLEDGLCPPCKRAS